MTDDSKGESTSCPDGMTDDSKDQSSSCMLETTNGNIGENTCTAGGSSADKTAMKIPPEHENAVKKNEETAGMNPQDPVEENSKL